MKRRPRPDAPPADLLWCIRCRKPIGPRGGWWGGECQCGRPPPDAPTLSHSIKGPLPEPPPGGYRP